MILVKHMQSKKISIASIIITYQRVSEAKAQMDIIRQTWQPLFKKVDIYHEFNGKKSWYPKKYQEDFLHRHKSMSHFVGANHLLNEGIKHVLSSNQKYDYIIAASSDAWFYDPNKLKRVILTCQRKGFQLATSLWGGLALSTEFFILTPSLAQKLFPLNLTKIINKSRFFKWAYSKVSIFESAFTFQVMRVLKNPNKIYLIPGRRVILLYNWHYSPHFYASHHDRRKRKKDISPKIRHVLGQSLENMPSLNKFLAS